MTPPADPATFVPCTVTLVPVRVITHRPHDIARAAGANPKE